MRRYGLLIPLFLITFIVHESTVSAQPGRQGAGRGGPGQQAGRGQGGPNARGGAGQQPPWVGIFDSDGNGELSASEIKNAASSLLKLDGNKDGKISGDELRFGGAGGQQNRGQRGGSGAGGAPGARGAGPRRGPGGPGAGGGPGNGRPGGGGGNPAQADAAFAAQVLTLDANQDTLIQKSELPDHMHKAFLLADADKSGALDKEELLVLAAEFRRNKLNPEGGERVNAPTQGRPGAGSGQGRGGSGMNSPQRGAGQGRPGRPGGPGERGAGQGQRGVGGGQGQRGAGGGQGQRGAGGGQRGRPRDQVRPRDTAFNEKFPIGSQLPDSLKLYNADRKLVAANSIFDAKYTVVVGGCLTCPEYRNSYPEIEAVAADYRDKGVRFYFLFQALTHPENWGYVQPTSIQERCAQIDHAKELLKTSIPWLADTMDNEMKQHFAMTPNSQFVFDDEGKIVHRASWGRGSSLREWLEELVGPSKHTTTVAELNLPKFGSHRSAPSEMLVERKFLEGVASPLKVAAGGEELTANTLLVNSFVESNRYVKLRPEADRNLLQTGTGQLYLGFRQDPVLGASWNNLASPPKYRANAEGVSLSPATAEAQKLDLESDNEPREFILDVKNWEPGKPLKVEIQYFACNKKEGWCKAVEQEFTVWLEQDQTAGMVNGRSHFPGGRGRQNTGGNGQRFRPTGRE